MFNNYEHFIAGISGGTVSTIILHPLDLLKIRFAANDGMIKSMPKYTGLLDGVKVILKSEGVNGLYRGVLPNMLGSGASWGIYFFLFKSAKNWFQDGDPNKSIGWTKKVFAAAQAGVITNVLTNPLWVIKTRLCLQYSGESFVSESYRYSGTVDAIRKIFKTEGFRGFYKGLVPGFLGITHGCVQMYIYDELKEHYNTSRGLPMYTTLDWRSNVLFAAISKMIAALTTYPYQVVRTRLQDHHHHYEGTKDCITRIWRLEGIKGFYKGLSPYLVHVTPNVLVVFCVMENFDNIFSTFKSLVLRPQS